MTALPAQPNHRSKIRVSPEFIKQTDQMLEKVSLEDLLDEQISEQTMQEFTKIFLHELSLSQLQAIFLQFPIIIVQMKLLIIKCKQDELVDSELAGLLCASLKELNIIREQNSITQKKKEKLDKMLNLAKQKLTKLVFNKQIEPLLAKPLMLILPIISIYMKTLKIIKKQGE
ncbi:MAG: hypothetical protein ACRCU0_03560 [Candidatus Rhabdochlamydia sp.]